MSEYKIDCYFSSGPGWKIPVHFKDAGQPGPGEQHHVALLSPGKVLERSSLEMQSPGL